MCWLAGFIRNRQCLREANAKVDCLGAYPQVLPLSAYWDLDTQFPSTARPSHATPLSEQLSYAYSHHLYVYQTSTIRLVLD